MDILSRARLGMVTRMSDAQRQAARLTALIERAIADLAENGLVSSAELDRMLADAEREVEAESADRAAPVRLPLP